MRRVHTDGAQKAFGDETGRVPHQNAAPVMADPDGLFDPKRIQKPGEIAHQMIHAIGLDRMGGVRGAEPAIIRGDDAIAGVRQILDLLRPAQRQLRPAMHQQHRHAVFGTGQMHREVHLAHIDLLRRRHGRVSHDVLRGELGGPYPRTFLFSLEV
jgi:hypothetical protein